MRGKGGLNRLASAVLELMVDLEGAWNNEK